MRKQISWFVIGFLLCALGLVAIPNELKAATAGSVIGTSTTNAADSLSFQRKSFYANTRFYVFYSDGANMTYRTSLNGIDWNTPASPNIRACVSGDQFSVWFDGTYVHYAFSTGASGTHVYYRRGTPNGGGNITWGSAEVVAIPGVSGVICSIPSISVDSTGSAWIGYRRIQSGNLYAYVVKNKNTNGTWATASGFPYNLSGYSAAAWVATPVPLDSGKVVAIYGTVGQVIRARSWNGTAWVGGFTTVSGSSWLYFSAVGKGDDVHLAFLNTSRIIYVKYNFSSNSLGPEEVVQGGVTSTTGPVLSLDSTSGDLHLFWAGAPTASRIFYKQSAGGKWDAAALNLVDESSQTLSGNGFLTTPYATGGTEGKIVFYLTKAVKPFNVKSSRGAASLSISKSAPTAAYLGDTITYDFTLKNNGNVPLNSVQVNDNLLGQIGSTIATLTAGSSVPFSVNYTVKNTAPNPLVNTVTAQGTYGSTQITDSDSWSVKITNPIQVTKTAQRYVFDGNMINYTINVKNIGQVALTNILIEDTSLSISQNITSLDAGASVPTITMSKSAGGSSPIINTVNVTALYKGNSVSNSATWKMYPITIRKEVIGDPQDNTLFEVQIKDENNMGLEGITISQNNPKKIWFREGKHAFKEIILYPSCYRLVSDPQYEFKYYPQYDSEFAQVNFEAGKTQVNTYTFKNKNYCKICIDKSGPDGACLGDRITYDLKVWNCSEATPRGGNRFPDPPDLFGVTVKDPLLGIDLLIGDLPFGSAPYTFTKDYTLPMSPAGPFLNTATATGWHPLMKGSDLEHPPYLPTGKTTVTASDSQTVNLQECRKAQICGFKFDDFNGDGGWTICHHVIFSDQFDNGFLDNWVPIPSRGTWVEEDGFLKQTDKNAGSSNDGLILYGYGDESKKYASLSYRTWATPVDGNADFGLVFFAQDDSHYFLFRVDGTSNKIGVFRRNGTGYETIIEKDFAEVGITFPVETGKIYAMKINTYHEQNMVLFYFSEPSGELSVFALPLRETFGCVSGYLGLLTNYSAVNFDWAFQSAEVGIEGWQINLSGPINATTTTRPDGSYCFYNLPPGTYTVSEVLQPGWGQTFPPNSATYEIGLAPGQAVGCVNFGNGRVVSLSGFKFADCNGDGTAGEGEYGLAGWKISLYKQNGVNWDYVTETITEPDGYYAFEGLAPGVYKVVEESRLGWENTLPGGGEYILSLGGEPKADLNFGNHWIGAASVEFIGYDTTTQGFWETQYGTCFYALPNPGAKKDPELTAGPGWYSENSAPGGQYNYDKGNGYALQHEVGARNNPGWEAQFDFRVFDYDYGQQTNAYAWPSKATYNLADGTVKPENYLDDPCSGGYYGPVCGAQFKPSMGKYFAVTWDSDECGKEPLIAEVKIKTPGLYRVTFNIINPNDSPIGGGYPYYYEGERAQDFWLWINGNDSNYNPGNAVWSGHRDPWTGSIYLSFMITAEEPITVALGAKLTNCGGGPGYSKNAYISGVFVDCICGPQIVQPKVSKSFELTVTNPMGTPEGGTYWASLSKDAETWGPFQLTDPDQNGTYTYGSVAGLKQGNYHYRFFLEIGGQQYTIKEGDESLSQDTTNRATWTWFIEKAFTLHVLNPGNAPAGVEYFGSLSSKNYGGSYEVEVRLVGGPSVYMAILSSVPIDKYDWEIFARWGTSEEHTLASGTETIKEDKTNSGEWEWLSP